MDEDAAREKQRLRDLVWRRLQDAGAGRFPYGSGRIPNFAGASEAAERLAALDEWQRARVLKCNPDYAQMPLRKLALRQGKLIYMAVPRLQGDKPFIELDPARVRGKESQAATISGAEKLGRPVAPEEMQRIDAVICGSVAVAPDGSRLGKGGGFSDLELVIVEALGLIDSSTPVMTTVHELQVLDEPIPMLSHDIVLSHYATPSEAIECSGRSRGALELHAELLNEEQLTSIPLLRRLLPGMASAKVGRWIARE
jgi:5-formyltetrahydrofolate cyclo-ligase